MKKIPNIISSVSVRYFRSINSLDLKKVEQVNIITGANDVGKSNLIRALNLFFNESDDVGNDIIFGNYIFN
jgi:AAA15 family ATPase/GTPase